MKVGSLCEDSYVNTMGIRGFPNKCMCGRKNVMFTSKSKTNPGRPFFRCPTLQQDHLFKWVEETVYEEVEDAVRKLEYFESEFGKAKMEIDDMKNVNLELTGEVLKTKDELKRLNLFMKVGFGSLCVFIVICVFIITMRSNGLNLSS